MADSEHTAHRQRLQQRIAADPQDWQAWAELAEFETALPQPSRSVQALLQARAWHGHRLGYWQQLLLALGRLGDAQAAYPIVESLLSPQWPSSEAFQAFSPADREAYFALLPLLGSIRILLLFGLPEIGNRQLRQALADLDQRFYAPIRPLSRVYANEPDGERRLRIGLVSNEWHSHVLAISHLPLLRQHDPEAFRFVAYDDGLQPPNPARLAAKAPFEAIHASRGWHPYRFYHQVQADRIDILIDLSGHLNAGRLSSLALRPAPLQLLASYNPPFTSGLQCMDYAFSDRRLHDSAETLPLTETQLMLEIFFYWHPPPEREIPPLPLLQHGAPSFGVIASPNKYSERALELWAGVLQDHPDGRLLLKDEIFQDPGFVRQFRQRFAAAGGDAGRLQLRDNRHSPSHLPFLAEIDILLDSSPSPGGLSTCDALWMGVPVLSLAGERRLPTDIHLCLGTAAELLASDPADYRRKALQLTRHPQRLAQLRGELRQRLLASPICALESQATQRAAHYRSIWRQWCRSQRR